MPKPTLSVPPTIEELRAYHQWLGVAEDFKVASPPPAAPAIVRRLGGAYDGHLASSPPPPRALPLPATSSPPATTEDDPWLRVLAGVLWIIVLASGLVMALAISG